MTSQDGVPSSAYWHKRAEEARTLADEMRDESTKATIAAIARMYEDLASRAAEREARDSN
jgi:hypothetical protein